jgi:hypothetical protein
MKSGRGASITQRRGNRDMLAYSLKMLEITPLCVTLGIRETIVAPGLGQHQAILSSSRYLRETGIYHRRCTHQRPEGDQRTSALNNGSVVVPLQIPGSTHHAGSRSEEKITAGGIRLFFR